MTSPRDATKEYPRLRALFEAMKKRKQLNDSDWESMTDEEKATFAAALDEVFPSETGIGWIACADRHPGNYETVLVVDGDGIRSTGFWNGSRWSVDVCEGTSDPYLVPTNWMPLPAAPKLNLMATLKDEMKKREAV